MTRTVHARRSADRARGGRRNLRTLIAAAALVVLAAACMTRDQRTTFDLVNQSRANNGRTALGPDAKAQNWAQNWAQHLANVRNLDHSDLDELLHQTGARSAGENVGYGSTIQQVHQAYMASPAHRANILGPWTDLGVGVARKDGRVYTVHVFLLY